MDLSQQSTVEQFDTPLKNSENIIKDVESPIPTSPKEEKKNYFKEVPKGVWGTHLNHEKKEDSVSKIDKKENPNLSITKKLFCGSKFTKRNPRKSLSFSHKTKSNISVDDNMSSSQPITSNANGSHNVDISSSQPLLSFGSFASFDFDQTISTNQNDNTFKKDSVKMQLGTMSVQTQPVNVIQTVIENNYKTLRTVDTGWLQMVAQENGVIIDEKDLKSSFESAKPISFPRLSSASSLATESFSSSDLCKRIENTKLDYDSEDIIEESDDETCSKDYTSLHISKKRKIEPALHSQTVTLDSVISNVQTNTDYSDKVVPIQNQVDTDNCMDVEDYEKIVARTKHSESAEGIEVNRKKTEDVINEKIVINEGKNQLQDSIHKEAIRESKISNVIESNTSQKRGNATRKVNNSQKKTKPKAPRKPRTTPVKKTKTAKRSKATNDPDHTPRKSTRQTRAKASFQELSSGEEDPFSNDDDRDKNFEPNNENQYGVLHCNDEEVSDIKTVDVPAKETRTRQKRATSKTPRTRVTTRKAVVEKTDANKQKTPSRRKTAIKISTNKDNVETNHDEEQKTYDLEFSVKPRIVAPRYTNIKQILAENKIKTKADTTKKIEEIEETITEEGPQLVKSKRQLEKEAFEKKIASGKLNDNFVRINIQKKVFARGKSFNKFSKYKKSQWKAAKAKALCGPDMDMGGCDGGMLVCFNCGQTGHFARNCKASKGDSLLPLTGEMEEDEIHLPTLEEAAKMAEGALKIRAPSLLNQKEQILGSNGDSDLSGDEKTNENGEDRIIECSQDEDDGDTKQNDTEYGFDEEGLNSELLLEEALKLEEYVRQLDVQQYLDRVKVVEPYYQPNEDGSIIGMNKLGLLYF